MSIYNPIPEPKHGLLNPLKEIVNAFKELPHILFNLHHQDYRDGMMSALELPFTVFSPRPMLQQKIETNEWSDVADLLWEAVEHENNGQLDLSKYDLIREKKALPPASILEQLEETKPGATDRIIGRAEITADYESLVNSESRTLQFHGMLAGAALFVVFIGISLAGYAITANPLFIVPLCGLTLYGAIRQILKNIGRRRASGNNSWHNK